METKSITSTDTLYSSFSKAATSLSTCTCVPQPISVKSDPSNAQILLKHCFFCDPQKSKSGRILSAGKFQNYIQCVPFSPIDAPTIFLRKLVGNLDFCFLIHLMIQKCKISEYQEKLYTVREMEVKDLQCKLFGLLSLVPIKYYFYP